MPSPDKSDLEWNKPASHNVADTCHVLLASGQVRNALKQVTNAAKVLFGDRHVEAVLEAAERGSWRDSRCALAGIPFY